MTKPCTTIRKYESAAFIIFKGLTLDPNEDIPKLSTFKDNYLEKLKLEIHGVFPEPRGGSSLVDMEVFDPRLFRTYRRNNLMAAFRRASNYLGVKRMTEQ